MQHNGALSRRERWDAALANAAAGSVLTSFTALEAAGLRGWERDTVHIACHAGAQRISVPGLSVVLHRTAGEIHRQGRRHHPASAALLAAASFTRARPAVGLLAALVQQRMIRPNELGDAVAAASRLRHRHALMLACADIGMGSHALSEIDFVRLCRRTGLPLPRRQAVRKEPSGRRRYLDAEWVRSDGSVLAVEVDGSLHRTAQYWWSDQLRQNELVIVGTAVLRFPTVVVREETELVAGQLGRALFRRSS